MQASEFWREVVDVFFFTTKKINREPVKMTKKGQENENSFLRSSFLYVDVWVRSKKRKCVWEKSDCEMCWEKVSVWKKFRDVFVCARIYHLFVLRMCLFSKKYFHENYTKFLSFSFSLKSRARGGGSRTKKIIFPANSFTKLFSQNTSRSKIIASDTIVTPDPACSALL